MIKRGGAALLVGLMLANVVACDSTPQDSPGLSADPDDYPKLARPLFELAIAPQPDERAKQLGLDYKNGVVQVIVEVQEVAWAPDVLWAVEALQGQVEATEEALLQARLSPKALLLLAKHPRVAYIRAPAKAKFD